MTDYGRFCLHVGYPKTGSSFFLQRILPNLKANIVRAPDVDPLTVPEPFDAHACRATLLADAEHRGFDVTVLSQVNLSGRNPARWGERWSGESIAVRLREVFPDARILLVVRSQIPQLISNWLYSVAQNGEWRDFPAHLRKSESVLVPRICYDGLVAGYRELFGPENVLVLPFERLRDDGPGFVEACASFVGTTVDLGAIEFRPVNAGHRSARLVTAHRSLNFLTVAPLDLLLDKGAIGQKLYYRLTHLWYAAKWGGLGRIVSKLFDRGSREVEIDLDAVEPMIREIRKSNRRLAEMTGVDLAKYGYVV